MEQSTDGQEMTWSERRPGKLAKADAKVSALNDFIDYAIRISS